MAKTAPSWAALAEGTKYSAEEWQAKVAAALSIDEFRAGVLADPHFEECKRKVVGDG